VTVKDEPARAGFSPDLPFLVDVRSVLNDAKKLPACFQTVARP